jgi:hypothetical protein
VAYKGDIKASKVAGPKQSIDYVRLSRDFLINHITTTTQPKFVKLSSLSWCQQGSSTTLSNFAIPAGLPSLHQPTSIQGLCMTSNWTLLSGLVK